MSHMVIRPTGARSDKGNKLLNDVISTAENVQFRTNGGIHAWNTKMLTNCVILFDRYTLKIIQNSDIKWPKNIKKNTFFLDKSS
jgi:hypothetical protein